jgi:rRNA maturation protein Nop10
MQPHRNPADFGAICAFTAHVRCPHCGDWMVAPVSSEFVEGVEIRHYWECESCGEASSISIPLTQD